jgi:hypothetical protein
MPNRIPTYRPSRPPGLDRHRQYNRQGRDATLLQLYSTARWRRFRAYIRAIRMLCERCKPEGRVVEGVHVHHVIDPRNRPDLTYDEGNVELLCHSCHSSHHATEKRKP